jgi:hypothetical protein
VLTRRHAMPCLVTEATFIHPWASPINTPGQRRGRVWAASGILINHLGPFRGRRVET